MLMSFRAKSKDKSDTHEALETNRTVCTKHEKNMKLKETQRLVVNHY